MEQQIQEDQVYDTLDMYQKSTEFQPRPDLKDFKKKKRMHLMKSIFRVGNEDLTIFFEDQNIRMPANAGECRQSLNILKKYGYNEGLLQLLVTDKDTGIIGDDQDLKRRRGVFGKNNIVLPQIRSFLDTLAFQFEDKNIIFLIVVSTFYLLISLMSGDNSYIECLTIFVGVFSASFIAAICEHIKNKQFLGLQDEINKEIVIVYRGQYGTTMSVPVRELVVGDIIHVEQGDRVPADCVLVEEMNITTDQTMYNKEDISVPKEDSRQNYVDKENYRDGEQEADNHKANPDCFLLTGSMVMTGQGKAVVCAVGEQTRLSRHRQSDSLIIKQQETFLEDKLNEMVKQISKYAVIAAFFIVVTQCIYMTILLSIGQADTFFAGVGLYAKIVIVGVSILIVSIPEGAPLAASIAMALSTQRLKRDNILIKNLEAVQTCSMLHDICIGKTGTITEGQMNVESYQFCDGQVEKNVGKSFSTSLEVIDSMKDLVTEAIIANTDVRFEANEEKLTFEPQGQALEVAMIKFLLENDINAHQMLIDRNRFAHKVMCIPFSQEEKMMVLVRDVADDPTQVRIYCKGAPESVLPLCQDTYDPQFTPRYFQPEEQLDMLTTQISNQMAQRGHKVLTYAFRQMAKEDLKYIMEQHEDIESIEFKNEICSDMTYLCTFGLDDPIRSTVQESIQLIKYGTTIQDKIDMQTKGIKNQVNIRMVTGDHIDTAIQVAMRVGIISFDEKNLDGIALTGEVFRERIGQYQKIWDKDNQEWRIKFQNKNHFNSVKSRLRIIARATAEDKLILIQGIKQEGGLVGMSGDSVSDSTALKMAQVGLSMGSGCTVAKENADLVILDNDFLSIHHAIMWGRVIFDNVRKFMQFQLTINICLCLIVLISGITLGNSPLNVIQLLWINLIMDTLGAIAICTEPFEANKARSDAELNSNRISRRDKIITAEMWRNIIGQVIYQMLAILILMYFGHMMFFEKSFNLITEVLRDDNNEATDKMRLHTMIFHCFVLMNLFNQINSRVIFGSEKNVFKTLCNNPFFWMIFSFEMGLQCYMVHVLAGYRLGSALLQITTITQGQTITCWCLGAGTLVVHVLMKFVPIEKFAFTEQLNLEQDTDDNKLLQWKTMVGGTLTNMEKAFNDNINDEDTVSVQDGINASDDEQESDGDSGTASDDQEGFQDQADQNTSRYSMSYKNGKANKN